MDTRPYLLGLAAGVLAAINPCGFALLPAYLGLLLNQDGERSGQRVVRAVTAAAWMTTGFVLVFGGFGLLVVPLALSIERFLPWVTVLVGLLLGALGLRLLLGREVALRVPRPAWAPQGSGLSWAGYGVAYALASLSCTAGPFLALTASTFRSRSVLAGLGVFVAYALGLGLLVGALSVGVALAREGLLHRVRQAAPLVARVSGGLLLLTALYVTWYGWYEIRLIHGGDAEDPVVGVALSVQRAVVRLLDGVGASRFAVVAALLAGTAVAVLLLGRSRAGTAGRGLTGTPGPRP